MRTALLAILIFTGCQEQQMQQATPLPNASARIRNLSLAKSNAETIADCVSRQPRPFKRARARDLYNDAKAAHNATISEIIVALRDDTANQEAINRNLEDARKKYNALVEWHEGRRKGGELVACSSAAPIVGVLVDLAGLLTDVAALRQAKEEARINELIRQLEGCKWRAWDEILK